MTTVALVCGYDLDSDLRDYTTRVAVQLEGERLDAVILSGGRTSPSVSDSEARAMAEHLARKEPVLLDHEAMTTLDNIVFGKRLAAGMFQRVERWIVCCDRAHAAKVWLLARTILRGEISLRAVHRPVPLHIRLREPFSIAIEMTGALVPPLRPLLRAAAMRMKGVSAKQRRSARPAAALTVAPRHPHSHTSGTADPPAPTTPEPRP